MAPVLESSAELALKEADLAAIAGSPPEKLVKDCNPTQVPKVSTGILSLDYMLGGGLALGYGYLIGGTAGAGKSTLLMQIAAACSVPGSRLYVSAEETQGQVASRAQRLRVADVPDLYLLGIGDSAESSIEPVLEVAESAIRRTKAQLVIIDSIQRMRTGALPKKNAGHPSVVRYLVDKLTKDMKRQKRTLFMVSQINREGTFEGLMGTEHAADVLLFIEGPRTSPIKTLQCLKSRAGPTDRPTRLRMTELGFVDVVPDEKGLDANNPPPGSHGDLPF